MIFISLDGVDNSGKTTIIKRLKEKLEKLDLSVLQVADPKTTELGIKIRDILLDNKNNIPSYSELYLFLSARYALQEYINGNKDNYDIVLSDRYIDSTYVYQSVLNDIPIETICKLSEPLTLYPDMTFIIDVSEETVIKRGNLNDRLENKLMPQLKKVRNAFIELEYMFPFRNYFYINGENDIESIASQIVDIISHNITLRADGK